MRIEGKIWKDGRFWLVEVPELDVTTQGKSRRDAFRMIREAIELLVEKRRFRITVVPTKRNHFFVESNDIGALLALLLKRQRIKNDLSISEVARRMKATSKNAYAQYEQGKSEPSLSKVQQLLKAMNPRQEVVLKVSGP